MDDVSDESPDILEILLRENLLHEANLATLIYLP